MKRNYSVSIQSESIPKTVVKRPCANCGEETTTNCGNCRKEFFCSVICQKAQRRKHKLICFPAKEEVGVGVRGCGNDPKSFWVATRIIEPGERIFTDYPLMFWPGYELLDPGEQVCLGCHKILKNFVMESDPRKCGNCKWPLCGETCSGIDLHAKECHAFHTTSFDEAVRKSGYFIFAAYSRAEMVRLQNIRRFDPTKWEQLLNLCRPDRDFKTVHGICQKNSKKEPNLNKSRGRLLSFDEESDEAKLTISGIMEAQSYHKCCPYFLNEDKAEYVIYDKETRMDFSCMENCFVSKIPNTENKKKGDDEYGITMVAAKRIERGQRLTMYFSTAYPRWDGPKPRRQIREIIMLGNVGILCRCARCVDPTELGTNISAVKCTQCIPGYLFPLNPTDNDSNWKCDSNTCSVVIPGSVVDKIVEKIEWEAEAIALQMKHSKDNKFGQDFSLTDAVHNFVEKYEKILNPRHYVFLHLQELTMVSNAVTVHRAISEGKLTTPVLTIKINRLRTMAEMHLDIANKLFPPHDKHQFHAQFVLGMTKFFSAQQSVRNGGSIDEVLNWLEQGVTHKHEVDFFKFKKWLQEPDESYGRLEMHLEEAYNNALGVCTPTQDYSVIPNKMIQFVQTLTKKE